MNKKKIIFIANEVSFLKSHRSEIINESSKIFDVFIISRKNSELDEKKVKYFNIDLKKNYINPIKYLLLLIKLSKIIKKITPDIIHVIGIKPILFFSFVSLFQSKKIKIVYSFSGLGIIFSSNNFLLKYLSKIVKFIINLADNNRISYIFQKKEDLKKIFSSSKISKSRIYIIPGSGINFKQFNVKNHHKTFLKKRIVYVSRVKKSKGINEFINLAKYINYNNHDFEFRVAGNFDSILFNKKFKQETLLQFKKNQIIYDGYVENINKYLHMSSLIIFPSTYGEGIPKILLESLAVGLPIISNNIPGLSNLIINDYNGFISDFQNIDKIIDSINKIFVSKEIYSYFCNNSVLLSKNFDVKNVIELHLKIYN